MAKSCPNCGNTLTHGGLGRHQGVPQFTVGYCSNCGRIPAYCNDNLYMHSGNKQLRDCERYGERDVGGNTHYIYDIDFK